VTPKMYILLLITGTFYLQMLSTELSSCPCRPSDTQNSEVSPRFWKKNLLYFLVCMKLPTVGQLLSMQRNYKKYTKRYRLDEVWSLGMKKV